MALTVAALMLLPMFVMSIGAEDSDKESVPEALVYSVKNVVTVGENLFEQEVHQEQDGYSFYMTADTWYYVNLSDYDTLQLCGYPKKSNPLDKFTKYLFPGDSEFIFYTGTVKEDWLLIIQSTKATKGTIQKVESFDSDYDPRFTDFEQDHANLFPEIDLSKYDGVTGDFIELITVYENIEIAEDYTWDGQVYLYLFNASNKSIKGGTLTCPDDDGNSTAFSLYQRYGYDNNRFIKLEVTGY